jgi:hypothetical protein
VLITVKGCTPNISNSFVVLYTQMLCTDIIPPTQLISLKYLQLLAVNLRERGEVSYIVNVLKSAFDLVELDIQVTMNTLCFLSLSFYCYILTLFFLFFRVVTVMVNKTQTSRRSSNAIVVALVNFRR